MSQTDKQRIRIVGSFFEISERYKMISNRMLNREDDWKTGYFFVFFVAIVLTGAVLRLWDLDFAPLWMDEAVTLGLARLPTETILFGQIDNHPPLLYLIQHWWLAFVPQQEWARLPVAMAGILNVIVFLLMVRDLISARAAVLGGLLFSFSTAHIYYSQDLRMYSYVMLGLTLASWGGLGQMMKSGQLSASGYRFLYILGGFIAIYSHVISLFAMALIGFSLLATWLTTAERVRAGTIWLLQNCVLLVLVLPWLVQVPFVIEGFQGPPQQDIIAAQWMFRNVTGFPGLGWVGIFFEGMLYLITVIAIMVSWQRGSKPLALYLFGFLFVYPALIVGLNNFASIYANRVFLPSLFAVTIGSGYVLSMVKLRSMGVGIAGGLAGAALVSSLYELKYRIKIEDYPTAFKIAADQGAENPAILSCYHFSAAAIWEANPNADIYLFRKGGWLRYKGPEYWRAAAMPVTEYRKANTRKIGEFLGPGWYVNDGLEEIVQGRSHVVFMRNACGTRDAERLIQTYLPTLGFDKLTDILIDNNASPFVIIEPPTSKVAVFERRR